MEVKFKVILKPSKKEFLETKIKRLTSKNWNKRNFVQ